MSMKCPYRNEYLQLQQTFYRYDDGQIIQQEALLFMQQTIWPECLQEQSAAWRDRICQYHHKNGF